jgi:glycosyltransferase involved in cell wall biosynthesis
MSEAGDRRDRITSYLRAQLSGEESYRHSYELDKYSRIVYRRLRELYWTVSRFLRTVFKPGSRHSSRAEAFAPGALGVIPAQATSVRPRIYIDATDFTIVGKATGIQRVLRGIVSNAGEMGLAEPVAILQGRFVAAARPIDQSQEIEVSPGDIVLLLDAGWNRLDAYPPALDWFRSQGGRVVACIYDVFPLAYPMLYTPVLVADFQAWIALLLAKSDSAVAISRSTAESFEAIAKLMQVRVHPDFRLGWWRLGADFTERAGEPTAAVRGIAGRGPFFLSVGTVEMRKGYPVALAAFEQLWAEGVEANFVIVGRPGWNAAAFEELLRRHPEKGRRLFWLDDAEDADLQFLYRETRAVILPTFAEGFGLPLVEAAQFGAPVIASDIDVFHEIGGPDVRYFELLNPESLSACIREALNGVRVAPKIHHLTWRESTEELMTLVRDGAYQRRLN